RGASRSADNRGAGPAPRQRAHHPVARQPRTSPAPGAPPLCEADNASLDSVRIDGLVLWFLPGQARLWGAMTMEAFGVDSSGWPVAPGPKPSSHFARHGLSRRAFIGGAAAAA